MTAIASVLMLTGAVLTLIAAVGVFRFPNTVARLHAATKAASVGIALVLVGAGAALGPAPLAFTSMVALFQIVTAPVAAHALGRAARPEPEADLEHAPSLFPLPARIAGLAVIWVALWGRVSVANVLGGLVVGAAVALVTGRSAGDDRIRLRPVAALRFGAAFVVLLVRSTIAVARASLGPQHLIAPVVQRLPLGPGSIPALVATANAVSLTPGTLTLALDVDEPALVVHLLWSDDEVLSAISDLHQLAAAALVPPSPVRGSGVG